LFCGAASGLPDVPKAACGLAGLLTLDIRSPRQNHRDRDSPAARPGPALLSGAMSSEFTASFGCVIFHRDAMVCPISHSPYAARAYAPVFAVFHAPTSHLPFYGRHEPRVKGAENLDSDGNSA